jgi:hypothetical protein
MRCWNIAPSNARWSASKQRAACGVCRKTCVAQAKMASCRRVRFWQAGERGGTHFEKCQVRFERFSPRQWSADQPDHLFYSLRRTLPVARWPPQTDQKSDVPSDAVADVTKPGQVDEQPFLEK